MAPITIEVHSLNIDASAVYARTIKQDLLEGGLVINLTASAEILNQIFKFSSNNSLVYDISSSSFQTIVFPNNNISSFSNSTSQIASVGSKLSLGSLESTMGHDFLGYLAQSIFTNTTAHVLFANGPEVANSVNIDADRALDTVFSKCVGDGLLLYGTTGSVTKASSPSQIITKSLLINDPNRFINKIFSTGNTLNNNFLASGDTVCFNCTVYPADGQQAGGVQIAKHIYLVKVLLS
jgi:hypothetical protein